MYDQKIYNMVMHSNIEDVDYFHDHNHNLYKLKKNVCKYYNFYLNQKIDFFFANLI